MPENNKISIVIPVYNVEKYLPECLDSILEQTYKNIEVICVNDGSTDNSLEVLKKYQKQDERIILINQENSGVACARNRGLEVVNGEYILFCDPDDYYCDSYAFEKLAYIMEREKSDVCVFAYSKSVGEKIIKSDASKRIENILQGKIATNDTMFYNIWNKIYRAHFLQENDIKFNDKMRIAEDILFSCVIKFCNPTIAFCDEAFYVYRLNRENSLTSKKIVGLENDIAAFKILHSMEKYQCQSENTKKIIINRFLYSCIYYYNRVDFYFAHLNLRTKMAKLVRFLEENYDKNFLKKVENYDKVKKLIKEIPFRIHSIIFKQKRFSDDLDIYFEQINFSKKLKRQIRKMKNKKIIIYGAGAFFDKIQNNFDLSQLNIIGICDKKFTQKTDEKLYGYEIILVDDLYKYDADCIVMATKNYLQLKKTLLDLKPQNSNTKIIPMVSVSIFDKYELRKI